MDGARKPPADFVIRLVGLNVRPWSVSLPKLTQILNAIQRLLEPDANDDAPTAIEKAGSSGESVIEPKVALHLIDVRSSSAAYRVSSEYPENTLRILKFTGKSIESPRRVNWPEQKLSSISDISDAARRIGCVVEIREAGKGSQYGNVIATISPDTYASIAENAFVHGLTTIYATIERVGGAENMRCMLRIPDQRKLIYCEVATEDLVRKLGAYIYQDVEVTGKATWFRNGMRLKTMLIHDFKPPKDGTIHSAFDKIHEAGGYAWDDIDDPESAIAEMRGR